MLRLAVILSVLMLCHARLPPNALSYSNNQLISTLDWIDDNLAHSLIDTRNNQKRAFSIIAEATLLYVTESPDTHNVIRKLHDLLGEPADVIAADPRKDLAYLKSILAQPINDIKRACKPDTKDMACVDILEYYYQQQAAKCPEYLNHVQLRDDVEKLILDKDYKLYLQGAINESQRGDDISAISYFLAHYSMFEDVFDKLRDIYKELKGKKYPCRLFGAYDSDGNLDK